jgi:hypothetical protein
MNNWGAIQSTEGFVFSWRLLLFSCSSESAAKHRPGLKYRCLAKDVKLANLYRQKLSGALVLQLRRQARRHRLCLATPEMPKLMR